MNINNIAVIICNYNGGADTIKCIDTVIKSNNVLFDIYVIDNASTDESMSLIQSQFSTYVTIIQNSENLGGSGGFGRGLRLAVEKGYPYIMMLDNDAYVDTDTVKKLYGYLQENSDVGIVGAKIMMSDDPERVMDYAKTINFETFIDESEWCGKLDSEETRIPRECDFAAATAAMVRREVLLACGGMDEEHFIYYDDIELGYRIKKHGYRVVSLGNAKAWHKSGMRQKITNTFVRYYITRNRHRFFAKYMPEKDIERFTEHILSRAFSYMYGSYYKGRMDIFDTEKYILEDFIRDRRGKAGYRRVNELQKDVNHLIEKELSGCKHIRIYPDGIPERHIVKLCNRLLEINPDIEIVIIDSSEMQKNAELCLNQIKNELMKNNPNITLAEDKDGRVFDKTVHFCRHVKDITKNILPDIYIDIYENMIASEQDYYYFRNYEKSFDFFRRLYHDSIIEAIRKIRKEG